MPRGVGEEFRLFYHQVKRVQQRDNLQADTAIHRNFAPASPDGEPLWHVLHLAPNAPDDGRPPAGDPEAGYRVVREMIERQYGVNTAERLFASVHRPGNGQSPKITIQDLDRFHQKLSDLRGFSQLAADTRHCRGASHIRFRHIVDEDGASASRLYVNAKKQWPWSKESRNTKQYRKDGGQKVWRLIAQEHGEEIANKAFNNVFGAYRLRGHERDHRIMIRVRDLQKLDAEIKRLHSIGSVDSYSQLSAEVLRTRHGMTDATPLLFDEQTGFRLATGGTEAPRSEVTAREAAAGPKVLRALEKEYGKRLASAIVAKALPNLVLTNAPRVTLGDLDRIAETARKITDRAVCDAADIYVGMEEKDPSIEPRDALYKLVADNREVIQAGLSKTPEPRSPHLNMIRGAMMFDTCRQAIDGDAEALATFVELVGAERENVPIDDEERKKWLMDQLHDRVFGNPRALGLDLEGNKTHKLLIELAAKSSADTGILRFIKLRTVFDQVLAANDGEQRRKATGYLIRLLAAQRDGVDVVGGKLAGAQFEEAVKAAKGRRLAAAQDGPDAPLNGKGDLMAELKQTAKNRGGLVSEEQVQEIQQLDREVSSLRKRRTDQQLVQDDKRLEQKNIGKLMDDAGAQNVDRPLMSPQELGNWIKTTILQGIAEPEKLSVTDLEREVQAKLPALQKKDQPLNANHQRAIYSLVLLSRSEDNSALEAALPGASIERRYAVSKQLRTWAASCLSLRGDWKLDKDGESIRFKGRKYSKVKEYGEGSFGVATLYEASDAQEDGRRDQIVVKDFKIKSKNAVRQFNSEKMEIRGHLDVTGGPQRHPNVLELEGFLFRQNPQLRTTGFFMTVTPVASGGELNDVFDKIDESVRDGHVTPEIAKLLKRRLVGQAVAGMAFMQQQRQMVHKDLKAPNIFVTADGTAKVADFGMAHSGLTVPGSGGTPSHMSPEMLNRYYNERGDRANAGTDVWSMGVLMRRELLGTKVLPGTEAEHKAKYPEKKFRSGAIGRKTVEVAKSDDFKVYKRGQSEVQVTSNRELKTLREVNVLTAQEKLINAMMDRNPRNRPTMQAVAEHEYFNDARLFDPALQQLTAAIIGGADPQRIRELGQAAATIDRL